MSNFHVVEFDLLKPFASPSGPAEFGFLTTPPLALLQQETTISTKTTLRASDSGYRTRASDPNGVVAYPPTIVDAFAIDVSANLDPTRSAVGASWGTIQFENVDGTYDAYLPGSGWSSDGQSIRVYRGVQTFDAARNLWIDPPFASLSQLFTGVQGPWHATATGFEIALNDATYYLQRQVPRTLYKGTGGAEGGSGLVGVSKPIGFGGNAVTGQSTGPGYIRNVTPTLVDGQYLVYQVNDGAVAWIGSVFDGGVAMTYAGDVADVYTGLTPPASWRSCNAKGLFQIGTAATFEITADFAMHRDSAVPIADELRSALVGILAVPDTMVSKDPSRSTAIKVVGANATALAHVAGASGYPLALFLGSQDQPDGIAFCSRYLSPVGGLLVGGRDGLVKVFLPSQVAVGTTPSLILDDTNIVSIEALVLPASINPAPWRIRVAYDRNYTILTSGLAGVIDQTQRAYLAAGYRTASAGVVIPVPRATDPAPLGADGGIFDLATATNLAADQVALWGAAPKLYNVTVPSTVGITAEWGDVVRLTSSFDHLDAGRLGQIVGWSYQSAAPTAQLRILS